MPRRAWSAPTALRSARTSHSISSSLFSLRCRTLPIVRSRFIAGLLEETVELRNALIEILGFVHPLPEVPFQPIDHPDGAVDLGIGTLLVSADADHVLVLAKRRQELSEAARRLLVGRLDDIRHHPADGTEYVDGRVLVLDSEVPRQDDVAVEDG